LAQTENRPAHWKAFGIPEIIGAIASLDVRESLGKSESAKAGTPGQMIYIRDFIRVNLCSSVVKKVLK